MTATRTIPANNKTSHAFVEITTKAPKSLVANNHQTNGVTSSTVTESTSTGMVRRSEYAQFVAEKIINLNTTLSTYLGFTHLAHYAAHFDLAAEQKKLETFLNSVEFNTARMELENTHFLAHLSEMPNDEKQAPKDSIYFRVENDEYENPIAFILGLESEFYKVNFSLDLRAVEKKMNMVKENKLDMFGDWLAFENEVSDLTHKLQNASNSITRKALIHAFNEKYKNKLELQYTTDSTTKSGTYHIKDAHDVIDLHGSHLLKYPQSALWYTPALDHASALWSKPDTKKVVAVAAAAVAVGTAAYVYNKMHS